MPRSVAVSNYHQSSSTAREYSPVFPPPSPYSESVPAPSTTSLGSFSSGLSSLSPDHPFYPGEVARLGLAYKRSESRLKAEQAYSEAQVELFERERREAEERHQREMEALRRQYEGANKKGKRRE
jgi:hypothetical protein